MLADRWTDCGVFECVGGHETCSRFVHQVSGTLKLVIHAHITAINYVAGRAPLKFWQILR